MDNKKIEKLSRMVMFRIDLEGKDLDTITEQEIDERIRAEAQNSKLEIDDETFRKIKSEFEFNHNIRQNRGESIVDNYDYVRDWYTRLMEKEDHPEEYFWKRYREYLLTDVKLNLNIVNLLDNTTLNELMNYLGDPKDPAPFFRRGLVIGDVQSGKTSTYTGLICKAADAGYRVIILLTGVTETLRSQTQKRMEEGIIGVSITGLKGKGNPKTVEYVGVGKDRRPVRVMAMTSLEYDFTGNKDQITTSLENHKLVMFIVKKNTRVLNKLYTWLHELNMDYSDRKIHYPMLMIDDECDNASIDTNKEEESPTKTNEIIRKLVHVFTQTSYVGFTATPYANVFINPDTSDDEMLKDDLFPKNFIYVLKPPSNYIGASKIFSYGARYQDAVKWIQDIDEPETREEQDEMDINHTFHYRHKKEWAGELPQSLRDAVYTFFLANVIRDLRGDSGEPRTMMVNMSRFMKVQSHIKDKLEDFYNEVYNDIKIDFSDNEYQNTKLPVYRALKRSWDANYAGINIRWEDAIRKENLLKAIGNIAIIIVNSGKNTGKLDYAGNPGLRVIAVGGLALSRGLTLEGLLVSYFYRNSAKYDVLMQMGRWFGYRKNYDDIFRIWISKKSAEWYNEIVEATDELKDDIGKMREARLTPEHFGMKVRNESRELQITANNKMRHALDYEAQLSFYGQVFDTPYLDTDTGKNNQNREKTIQLINRLTGDGFAFKKNPAAKNLYFSHNIPVEYITRYLRNIEISRYNIRFDTNQILDFLSEENENILKKWDIVLIEGEDPNSFTINDMKIFPVERSFDKTGERINIGGRRARLTSPTDTRNGLTTEQIKYVRQMAVQENEIGRKNLPREAWLRHIPDRNPLLMIYFIRLKQEGLSPKEKEFVENQGKDPLIGLSVGFPGNTGTPTSRKKRKYKINKIFAQQEAETIDEEIEE